MMHQYLRTVGFSKYKHIRELRPVLNRIIMDPENVSMVHEDDEIYGYFSRSFGEGFGLSLFVTYEGGSTYKEDYFFPYAVTDIVSSRAQCTVEKRSDRTAYSGMCDESAFGISLIFFLSNGMAYAKRQLEGTALIDYVALTALSISGKVLLPLNKTARQRELALSMAKDRAHLIEAAKDGDEMAMESLAIADMNTAEQLSERITREDVYSLVDNTFMPYGMESDKYSILAEILSVQECVNSITKEKVYRMLIECSGIRMGLLINSADLLGVPTPGCRFKGDVWLQGTLVFA